MKIVSIPNMITFVRIIIIPLFVTALVYERYGTALLLFVVAAVSDLLDGLLARLTQQQTELGAFLDPLADKALLVTSFILFAFYGWLPSWLTITVISRDLIVTIGWFVLYLLYGRTKVEPTLTGKTAIACQLVLIAYTLVSIHFREMPSPQTWMFALTAVLTIFSGLQYIYKGLKQSDEN
ncbi:MAG: CDP-diacylglycerol--glycerol-3-phosphate 3-phosphatidyltransferase [Nitrospirales bacterium]|nr:CDP-diacylglycerol--glycerol-3-phosphate 3-phosphatidyltransferase [Nitrospirales bacterium]